VSRPTAHDSPSRQNRRVASAKNFHGGGCERMDSRPQKLQSPSSARIRFASRAQTPAGATSKSANNSARLIPRASRTIQLRVLAFAKLGRNRARDADRKKPMVGCIPWPPSRQLPGPSDLLFAGERLPGLGSGNSLAHPPAIYRRLARGDTMRNTELIASRRKYPHRFSRCSDRGGGGMERVKGGSLPSFTVSTPDGYVVGFYTQGG